jgi:hypothetical protein
MKNSPMATVLLAILGVSAFVSLFLCWAFSSNTVELRRMQSILGTQNANRQRMVGLLNESAEYARRNPKIEPVLEPFGYRRAVTNAAGAKTPSR